MTATTAFVHSLARHTWCLIKGKCSAQNGWVPDRVQNAASKAT